MVTWAQLLASRSRQFHLDVRIEGVARWLSTSDHTAAGGDARYRFCIGRPQYAESQPASVWIETLAAPLPSILGEQVDLFGGFPQRLGGISVNILDAPDDFLTGLLRTEAPPVTLLSEDLDESETAVDVQSASGIAVGDTIFVGGEMMAVDAIASNTLTVRRGYGGTDAYSHQNRDKVFLYTPYIIGRRMELVIAPYNADSEADERVVGEYVIDSCAWSRDANVWKLTGKSQLKYIDRTLPRAPRTATIVRYEESQNAILCSDIQPPNANLLGWRHWPSETTSFPVHAFIQVGDEVIGVGTGFSTVLALNRRGVLNTSRDDLKPGTLIRQVFVSDPAIFGSSFRYSPGPNPSTNLSSGTWIKSDHWIDLILTLLTSPASADDPFDTAGNYDNTHGNWSVLPPGFGLGIPISLIDVPSFLRAKARTRQFKFPNFIYGAADRQSAAELISEHFLRPLGAYLSVEDGKIKMVLPRLPLLGEAVTTIGEDDFLVEQTEEGVFEPRIEQLTNTALHAPGVTYIVGPKQAEITFNNAEFRDTYGQRGFFVTDRDNARIPIPSGDPAYRNVYGGRAQARLFRIHRPNIELVGDVDFATAWNNPSGSLAQVTLPELIERGAGTRGWTNVLAEILEREVQVDETDGLFGRLRLITYGPNIRIGRVCPSAIVTAVSVNTATIAANRYTASDGAVAGLPASDVSTFQVGYVLRLIDLAGVDVGGGTVTVVSTNPGANTVTLSGNFGGQLAAGRVLVFAGFTESVTAQTGRYAYAADRATQTVGSSTTAPYLYGEA